VKKSAFYHTPFAFDTPVTGVPVGISAPLWYGKTRMVSLPDGEKNFEDIFIRFGATPERDGQTDGQTDGHRVTEIAALCIASHGKNRHFYVPRPTFFCLPWGRPCGNDAKCCMNEKTIQCLPNPSQHVPIYLQQFPSYSNRKCKKIAVFTYRSPHFCFPWGRPWAITLNVVWTKREFDAYKLSRCMCPSNYNRF